MLAARTRNLLLLFVLPASVSCAEDRVASARTRRIPEIRILFEKAEVAWPPGEIYLRAFKHDGVLELWAGTRGGTLKHVTDFAVCSASGDLGPKRRSGDLQVPEGFYFVDRFNPRSNFHLSLGIDYPNASDRVRGDRKRLGGDIFIHGDCVTVGCLPLKDGPIEVLYLIAQAARDNGQQRIPVHIFPTRMNAAGIALLQRKVKDPALHAFWDELSPGYVLFEETRRPPSVVIRADGRYDVRAVPNRAPRAASPR